MICIIIISETHFHKNKTPHRLKSINTSIKTEKGETYLYTTKITEATTQVEYEKSIDYNHTGIAEIEFGTLISSFSTNRPLSKAVCIR